MPAWLWRSKMKRSGAVLAAIAAAAVVTTYAALIVSTACPQSGGHASELRGLMVGARGVGDDGECVAGFLRVSRRRFWEYNAGLRDPGDAWPGLSEVIVAQVRPAHARP